MAGRIDHLVFWTGGVVLPRLSSLALQAMPARDRDLTLKRRLDDLERQLALGKIAAPDFCERAGAAAGTPALAGSLMGAVLAGADILPGMAALLADLAPRLRLGLVSDYPQPWLQTIVERSELSRLFGPGDLCYSAARPGADLFDTLAGDRVIRPGRTLWVDHDYPRAATAIRRGIDAAIFVDARRLRRDLGLWGILPLQSA